MGFIYLCGQIFIMKSVVLFFFLYLPAMMIGQTIIEKDGVEISENRLPGTTLNNQGKNIEVISSKEIQKLPVHNMSELLQYVSGVDLRARGQFAQADVSIQGSTFEQVLILIDGIPFRDPQTGHNTLNIPIPLAQIDRIEIIKGSASRIYGANALAGAINIITRKPTETLRINASSFWGTGNGSDQHSRITSATANFKLKGSHHSLGYENIESSGYRYNSSVGLNRISYIGQKLTDHGHWNWMANGVNNQFGANSFYAFPYDSNAFEKLKNSFLAVQNTRVMGKLTVHSRAFFRKGWDDYVLKQAQPSYYHNTHQSEHGGVSVNGSLSNKIGFLAFGTEGRVERINSSNLGQHQRMYQTTYVEQRIVNNGWTTVLGVNAQWATGIGWKIYPGIEMNKSWKHFGAFINSGTGSRFATYTDLYYKDRANQGNPNLQNETAISTEAGIRFAYEKLQCTVSGFQREVQGMIDYVRDSTNTPWIPQNLGLGTFQGGEFRGTYKPNYELGKFSWNTLKFQGNWIHAQYQSEKAFSKYTLDHLNRQVLLETDLSWKKKIGLSIIYRNYQRFTKETMEIFDLKVIYKPIPSISFIAEANNVFNKSYTLTGNVPMPGRWISLGFSIRP